MKKALSLILLSIFSFGFSQVKYQSFTPYFLFNAGYTYQNINYLNAGADLYLVMPNNNILDLGISADMGLPKDKFTAIPKAQLGYLFNIKNSKIDPYSSNFNAPFWLVRVNATPWSVQPEAGITVLSLFELTAGYSFEFKENTNVNMEGLKIGVNLKLPILLFWHE